MSKRILALLLCVVLIVPCLFGLSGCSSLKYEGDVGAYITMYLTDEIYDFDPANAYYNADAINVVSLMFDTLFKLNADGEVEESMVDEYEFYVDDRTGEHCLEIVLNEMYWTNGTQITANDVMYAWRRLLSPDNDFAAAALLYDIKNARAVKEGDIGRDELGINAVSISTVKVTFEGEVDEERFLLNLTNVATAPLLESYVSRNADWAKKPATIVCSGPFKLGKMSYVEDSSMSAVADANAIDKHGVSWVVENNVVKKIDHFYLERNPYYYRDTTRDDANVSVTSYRLLVDCSKTDAEILDDYKNGKIFYMGSIPMSIRNDILVRKEAVVSDALSTFILSMNQYALIDDNASGTQLFANENVRQALSLVIDRRAIQRKVVFAEAANGLVPPGVFNFATADDRDFCDAGDSTVATLANKAEALRLLNAAGITPSHYSFTIKVAAYDDVHVAIVDMVKDAWTSLGFKVSVNKLGAIQNNDYSADVESTPDDVCDDLIVETIQQNNYEVIAYDYVAYSADAFSVLAPFASSFSGMSTDFTNPNQSYDFAQVTPGTTGHVSVEYNILMEAVYYIPYYATVRQSAADSHLQSIFSTRPYMDTAKGLAQHVTILANNAMLSLSTDQINESLAIIQAYNDRVNEGGSLTTDEKNDLQKQENLCKKLISEAIVQMRNAKLDVERSFAVSGQTDTATILVAQAMELIAQAEKEMNDKNFTAAIATLETASEKLFAAADEATTAANNADGRTLYDFVGRIYAENGITPTTNVEEWAEQKSVLLHKAEAMLMKEMPVIPVIFNKNAILISDKLSDVNPAYYAAADLQKTDLDGYETYTYTLETYSQYDASKIVSTEIRSIFDDFPYIKWEQVGQVVREQSFIK